MLFGYMICFKTKDDTSISFDRQNLLFRNGFSTLQWCNINSKRVKVDFTIFLFIIIDIRILSFYYLYTMKLKRKGKI